MLKCANKIASHMRFRKVQLLLTAISERVTRQKKKSFRCMRRPTRFLPALRLGVTDKNSTSTEIIIRHDCDLRTRMEDD